MSTLAECDYFTISYTGVGSLCLKPADNQGVWHKNMPTASDWIRRYWYVFFALALLLVLGGLGIAFAVARWCRRIEHRHLRERRDKHIDGLLRVMSSSYRGSMSRKSSAMTSRRSSMMGGTSGYGENPFQKAAAVSSTASHGAGGGNAAFAPTRERGINHFNNHDDNVWESAYARENPQPFNGGQNEHDEGSDVAPSGGRRSSKSAFAELRFHTDRRRRRPAS